KRLPGPHTDDRQLLAGRWNWAGDELKGHSNGRAWGGIPGKYSANPRRSPMKNRAPLLAGIATVALSASAYTFGGWAVVTVDDLPEYLTVGQPTKIAFVVRQHGVALMGDVRPEVVATDGKTTVRATTPTMASAGHFAANLVVPNTGKWTVTVNSGWGKSA